MTIRPWKRLGNRIIASGFGKKFLETTFLDPEGELQKFLIFDKPRFSVILPVTTTMEIVAIRQYYQGAEKILLTLPGGNFGQLESSLECIHRELIEETGYRCAEIIRLGSQNWPDPRNIPSFFFCFLGFGCEKATDPQPDNTEEIEIELIPINKWVKLTESEIEDSCAVVATHKALPYLRQRDLLPLI